jgi:hypothetical protein
MPILAVRVQYSAPSIVCIYEGGYVFHVAVEDDGTVVLIFEFCEAS